MFSIFFISQNLQAKGVEAGTIEFRGDSNFSFDSAEADFAGTVTESDTLTIETAVLYYLTPNIAVGGLLLYESEEETSGGVTDELSLRIIGPAGAYSMPLSEELRLKVYAGLGLTNFEINSTDIDGTSLFLGAEVSYFFTDSVSVNGGLLYISSSLEDDANNEVELDDLILGVGFSVYLKN